MAHHEHGFGGGAASAADELAAVVAELASDADLGGVRFRSHCLWTSLALVQTALCWAWSSKSSLGERFSQALSVGRAAAGGTPVRVSYQAFMKLLVRWTGPLRDALADAFRRRMRPRFDPFRVGRFHVFAADGSHLALPRTGSNAAYAAPRAKKGKKGKKGRSQNRSKSAAARKRAAAVKKSESPQMRLTMLHHPGLRLPWDWRLGSYSAGERGHVAEMLATLPPDALIAADCGFAGYDFLYALKAAGCAFVIRTGGNVRLLRRLMQVEEADDLVHVWPAAARGARPPLTLRRVVVHDGRRTWHLVASELDPQRLSDREVAAVYGLRWRVEVFFRSFKQTFKRAKLRSGKAEHAWCEAQWSLLGLWGALLAARLRQEPVARGGPAASPAKTLRAFAARLDAPRAAVGGCETLPMELAKAVVDPYARKDKCSRSYPRKKYEKEPGPPQIHDATPALRRLARPFLENAAKERLAA